MTRRTSRRTVTFVQGLERDFLTRFLVPIFQSDTFQTANAFARQIEMPHIRTIDEREVMNTHTRLRNGARVNLIVRVYVNLDREWNSTSTAIWPTCAPRNWINLLDINVFITDFCITCCNH